MRLVELDDDDFAWMLGRSAPRRGLQLPPGGVDDPAVIAHIRRMTSLLHAAGSRGGWMMVEDDEVVGLCGFHGAPREGTVEIGYSVAPSRRQRGNASAAVAAIVALAPSYGVHRLLASTSITNRFSERVLERNGFSREGTRADGEDGPLTTWSKTIAP